jgi:hypothetical protein
MHGLLVVVVVLSCHLGQGLCNPKTMAKYKGLNYGIITSFRIRCDGVWNMRRLCKKSSRLRTFFKELESEVLPQSLKKHQPTNQPAFVLTPDLKKHDQQSQFRVVNRATPMMAAWRLCSQAQPQVRYYILYTTATQKTAFRGDRLASPGTGVFTFESRGGPPSVEEKGIQLHMSNFRVEHKVGKWVGR